MNTKQINSEIRKAQKMMDEVDYSSGYHEYDQETVEYWAGYKDALEMMKRR